MKNALDLVRTFIDIFDSSNPETGLKEINKKLSKKRPWADTRSEMSVALRPRIITITPELVALDSNERALSVLYERIHALDARKIHRASMPTGILFSWCSAVLKCAVSIRKRQDVENEIYEMVKFDLYKYSLLNAFDLLATFSSIYSGKRFARFPL